METIIKEYTFEQFTWIDICHPKKVQLDQLVDNYGLNIFQVMDSLQYGHLPKFEKSDKLKFLILRAFTAKPTDRITNIQELSNKIAFFYDQSKIITIHRSEFDFLERLSGGTFPDTDSLLIHIIHKMIETFVVPSSSLSNTIDDFEETIFLQDYTKVSIEDLYYYKSETRISKKLLQITQTVINQIEVNENSKMALQDIKDQLVGLILNYDEVAEESTNLLSTYMSVSAQRTNEVMKLLTVFSAFFLPLTFIVGVYGMNFEHMPELKWRLGYFFALGLMFFLAVFIFIWFKRKKII